MEEAISCYEAALVEATYERAPMQWAITQNNLAGALLWLGERAGDVARFEAAVTLYNDALGVFVAASATYYIEVCWENRDRAIALLMEHRGGANSAPAASIGGSQALG